MSNYLRIKSLFFILYLSIFIIINGKIAPQYDIVNNKIPSVQNEYKHCEFNKENNPKFFDPENDREIKFLKPGKNP